MEKSLSLVISGSLNYITRKKITARVNMLKFLQNQLERISEFIIQDKVG